MPGEGSGTTLESLDSSLDAEIGSITASSVGASGITKSSSLAKRKKTTYQNKRISMKERKQKEGESYHHQWSLLLDPLFWRLVSIPFHLLINGERDFKIRRVFILSLVAALRIKTRKYPERETRTSYCRTISHLLRPFLEDCLTSSSFLESPRYIEKLSTNHFVKSAIRKVGNSG